MESVQKLNKCRKNETMSNNFKLGKKIQNYLKSKKIIKKVDLPSRRSLLISKLLKS